LRYARNAGGWVLIRWMGVFLLIVTLMRAEEPPPLRMDATYVSSQVFRGVERAGDSAQAAVEFNRGGFRGGLWVNQAFDGGDTREVNLNAAYGWQPADGFTLEASVAHTWFEDVPGGGVDRSLEAGLTAMLAPVGGCGGEGPLVQGVVDEHLDDGEDGLLVGAQHLGIGRAFGGAVGCRLSGWQDVLPLSSGSRSQAVRELSGCHTPGHW